MAPGSLPPYGEGVSYWALGEIVKAQAGIIESDDAEVTASKLEAVVEALTEEGERAWVARHLRPLVGLGGDELSADSRGEAFAAWRRFVELVAENGPAVLVFEDLPGPMTGSSTSSTTSSTGSATCRCSCSVRRVPSSQIGVPGGVVASGTPRPSP